MTHNCTTGYLPKRYRCSEKKGYLYPNVYGSSATVAKLWKEPRCPKTDEWIRKMWSIYTMEYYASIRNDEYPVFVATWTGLGEIMLSQISQERESIFI